MYLFTDSREDINNSYNKRQALLAEKVVRGSILSNDLNILAQTVVDENGVLVGIITNTDMVRSHIERSTPNKVEYFKNTMEQLYGIKTTLKRMKVPTDKLRPTQDRVYADELEGRAYELEKGLADETMDADKRKEMEAFMKTIDEDDNNYIFIGKLKTKFGNATKK